MAVKTSKGIANYLASSGSLKEALDGGYIHVYKGTPPETPEEAVASGDILWTISVDGEGISLEYAHSEEDLSLVKPAEEIWAGPTEAGTATFFRIVGPSDDGSFDSGGTSLRVQGVVGSTVTADMYMTSTTFTADASSTAKVLLGFALTLPTY